MIVTPSPKKADYHKAVRYDSDFQFLPTKKASPVYAAGEDFTWEVKVDAYHFSELVGTRIRPKKIKNSNIH